MFPSPFARLFWHDISLLCNGKPYRKQQRKATEKPNCYQKVIICPSSEPRRLIFVYGGAIFALLGGVLFSYSGAIFGQLKVFSLSTAVQKYACLALPVLRNVITLVFSQNGHKTPPKILGTPAFAGTKTPAALKFSSKGATTDCVETPVNCPHCGQKWQRAALATPAFILLSFRPRKNRKKRRKRSHINAF